MQSSSTWIKQLTFPTILALFVVLGCLTYSNSLGNSFVGDDGVLIVINPLVHSLSTIFLFFTGSMFHGSGNELVGDYYRPVFMAVFTLTYAIFGATPFIFHSIQLAVHITNAILLYLITGKMLRQEIALGIGLVFLIHPINNETVVYISALQEPLFLLFGLIALWYIQTHLLSTHSEKMIVFCCLLLSLLTKETGVLFLLIIPLYQYLFQSHWRKGIIVSATALSIYLFLRFVVARIYLSHVFTFPTSALSATERFVLVPKIVYFYVKTFFYPLELLSFQSWLVKTIDFPNFFLPLCIDTLAITTIVLLGIALHNKKLHNELKITLFFTVWLLIGIVLHTQIIALDQTVADRWFYFPIIGLLGILGTASALLPTKKLQHRWIYLVTFITLLIVFSVRDIVRNQNWSDQITLAKHDLAISPDNYQLQNGLGYELINTGDFASAKQHLLRSTQLFPTNTNWDGLGIVYVRTHQLDKAKSAFLHALVYGNDAFAYESIAQIMLATDKPQHTAAFIRSRALPAFPLNANLWTYLAVAEYNAGEKEKALTDAQYAQDISPSNKSQTAISIIESNGSFENLLKL